jgi:rRNA maturation RNase YbeY
MTISFNKADATATLGNRVALKSFIEKRLIKEGIKIDTLNYVFCTDKFLLKINKEYLFHDYFTDIISFDLSEVPGQLIGEVYISVDRVKENAKSLNISFKVELHRVIFHGALHFCGYKDKKPSDAKKMRQMEDLWLSAYLPNGK